MGDSHNEVRGDVSGTVVQAHTIHNVHVHCPPGTPAPPFSEPEPLGPPAAPTERTGTVSPWWARTHSRREEIGWVALVLVIGILLVVLIAIQNPPAPNPVARGRVFHPPRTAPPAGSTLLFSDDFRRNSGAWTGIGTRPDGSSARIDTGDAQLVLTATPGGEIAVTPSADADWASATSSQVDLGFPDDQEVPDQGSFTVFCRVDGQGNGYGVTLLPGGTELTKYVSGKRTGLVTVSGTLNNSGTNLHLACTNENGGVRIRAWTDNLPVADYTDRTAPIMRGGPVTLRVDLGDGSPDYAVQVDDVSVYRPR